jgi:hypothetical protein
MSKSSARLGLAALSAAMLVAACDETPAPQCQVARPFSSGSVAFLTPELVRTTLNDAALRTAPTMGPAASDLQQHLTKLRDNIAVTNADACSAIKAARARLAEVPDDPANRPNRATLVLALDLAESYVATR